MKKVRITESQLRGLVNRLIREEMEELALVNMNDTEKNIFNVLKDATPPYTIQTKSGESAMISSPNNVIRFYKEIKQKNPNDDFSIFKNGKQIFPIQRK